MSFMSKKSEWDAMRPSPNLTYLTKKHEGQLENYCVRIVVNKKKQFFLTLLFWITHPIMQLGALSKRDNDIFAVSSPKVSGMSRQHTVSQGGKLKMKCKVSGSPKPRIMWLKNDRPLHQDIRISIKTKRYTLLYALKTQFSECGFQNPFCSLN